MSFALYAEITPGDDVVAIVQAAWSAPGLDGGPSAAEHQLANGTGDEAARLCGAAAGAAQAIASRLGDKWTTADVTISGHANPDHDDNPGWANDVVTVSARVSRYGRG